MQISTGAAESHPTPLPLDPQPPVAAPTPRAVSGPGQGGVFDATSDQQHRLSAAESDARAAQHAGMTAEQDRRDGHARDILPLGTSYGTLMDLPEVPAYQVPPPPASGYPFQGDEPVPA